MISEIEAQNIVDVFGIARIFEEAPLRATVTGIEDIDKTEGAWRGSSPPESPDYRGDIDFAPQLDPNDCLMLERAGGEFPVQFILQIVALRGRRDVILCQIRNADGLVYEKI